MQPDAIQVATNCAKQLREEVSVGQISRVPKIDLEMLQIVQFNTKFRDRIPRALPILIHAGVQTQSSNSFVIMNH
jgi:hypothetical protein